MSDDAKKLQVIEDILKLENETVLAEIQSLLAGNRTKPIVKKSFKDFAGIWTEEEAEEMKKFIEESCEQIDPDEWK